MAVKRSGGGFERLRVAIKELDSHEVRVGFFETAKYEDGTPVAYVASIHEFGSPDTGLPARPFFRPTIAAKTGEWTEEFAALARKVIADGFPVVQGMEIMGLKIAGDVSQTIASITSPPLKESTVRRKGHNKPLVETGQLLQSLTSEVFKK